MMTVHLVFSVLLVMCYVSTNIMANAFSQFDVSSSTSSLHHHHHHHRQDWTVKDTSHKLGQYHSSYRYNSRLHYVSSSSIRGGSSSMVENSKTSLHLSSIPPDEISNMSVVLFNNGPLWQSLGIFMISNLLGFVLSLLTKSHIHLDLLGTGAFALASIIPYYNMIMTADLEQGTFHRMTISTVAVSLWGIKLAGFLFFRALKLKRDNRLEELFKTFSGTCT